MSVTITACLLLVSPQGCCVTHGLPPKALPGSVFCYFCCCLLMGTDDTIARYAVAGVPLGVS